MSGLPSRGYEQAAAEAVKSPRAFPEVYRADVRRRRFQIVFISLAPALPRAAC